MGGWDLREGGVGEGEGSAVGGDWGDEGREQTVFGHRGWVSGEPGVVGWSAAAIKEPGAEEDPACDRGREFGVMGCGGGGFS